MKYFKILFFFQLLSLGSVSFGQEPLGRIGISDLTLRPQGYYREGRQGEFELGESSVGLNWSMDEQLSSAVRFGAHGLRAKPHMYQITQKDNELDLLEAYGQYEGILGRVRLGLIPLGVGREGQLADSELIFPRSAVFSEGLLGLRDFGLNYFITHNRFFTSWTVHNGESDSNEDNRTWYSARWGYDFRKLRLEMFGQTGSTTPLSTTGSLMTVARFDPSKESKWRTGGVYADWIPGRFRTSIEFITGDVEQEKASHRFATGHFDLGHSWKEGLGLFFRYNPFDPDVERDNDTLHNLSIAVVKANLSMTSKVILVGTKTLEEGTQIANDEIRLIWTVTPLYFQPNY